MMPGPVDLEQIAFQNQGVDSGEEILKTRGVDSLEILKTRGVDSLEILKSCESYTWLALAIQEPRHLGVLEGW